LKKMTADVRAPMAADGKPIEQSVPLVSVVIVNYNGLRFLPECLASLKRAFIKYRFEIIVVDNASQDGSREYLRTQEDIRLIESSTNTGFTGGNNIGALRARGKLLLLLNNDTQCLTSLDDFVGIMNDERIGVAGCALVYADGRMQSSVGYDHTPLRIVFSWMGLGRIGGDKSIFSRYHTEANFYLSDHRGVDWVSGACLLTRTELWRQLGGLDDNLFMYCEDVDYCYRICLAGFEVAYSSQAKVLHFEGGDRPWAGALTLTRTARSYLLLMRKRYGRSVQCGVAIGLGVIFHLRSLAYRLSSFSKSDNGIIRDKMFAYCQAGKYLICHALAEEKLVRIV